MTVLVTGGAGYIGAHVVRALGAQGTDVVIVDDLSTGIQDRVPGIPLHRADLASEDTAESLASFMSDHGVDAVIHLAARKQVFESVQRPVWYYRENIGGLVQVLHAMELARVATLVFSSSAAVYGDAASAAITEDAPTEPVNPYGETKLAGEWLVRAAARAQGLRAASLRYFNVVGAGSPELGDVFALNLVPMVFERVLAGEAPLIFGGDYPTKDGTCVRDFIHVSDLADAHVDVLARLAEVPQGVAEVFNVGTGTGYSVREVIGSVERAVGAPTSPEVVARRPGDPASVVADPSRLHLATGWSARHNLDEMVQSAWAAYPQREAG